MMLLMIKSQGFMGTRPHRTLNSRWLQRATIAAFAGDLLSAQKFTGHAAQDLYGDQLSFNDITAILKTKLNIPGLKYMQFPPQQAIDAMTGMGMSRSMAQGMVELSESLGKGKLHLTNVPDGMPNAPTRFAQFVDEVFAPAFRA